MSFTLCLVSAQEFLELHGERKWAEGLAGVLALYDQDPAEGRRVFRSMANGPASLTDFEIVDPQRRSLPERTAAWRTLVGRANDYQWEEEIRYRETTK